MSRLLEEIHRDIIQTQNMLDILLVEIGKIQSKNAALKEDKLVKELNEKVRLVWQMERRLQQLELEMAYSRK